MLLYFSAGIVRRMSTKGQYKTNFLGQNVRKNTVANFLTSYLCTNNIKMAEKDKESIEEQDLNTSEDAQEDSEKETVVEPKNELEDLSDQLTEQKEKYLRLFADFDNYKKRTAKERLDLLNTAGKDIILSVIPVIDDFERAIAVAEKATEVDSVKEGMELIKNKMFNVLQQRGINVMESVGEQFDAERHEAITEIPAPTEELKGKVIDEVEKGYTMNNKIIRYAKVVVGK